MIDASKTRKRQLAFELQSSRVFEKRSNLPKGKENHFKFISVTFNLQGGIPHGNEDKV